MYKTWKVELTENGLKCLELMRKQCMESKGCGAIKHISLKFRSLDKDFSGKISLQELMEGVEHFGGIRMTEGDIKTLFMSFDRDGDCKIDLGEFIRKLRPPMNEARLKVVDEVFNYIDANGDGTLNPSDIKARFAHNIRSHPKFIQGEWTEEQTLRNFLDTFDDPDDPDGTVTREEFLNYYSGVSVMYEDDEYFDFLMRKSYGLPPKGSEKKKANKQ